MWVGGFVVDGGFVVVVVVVVAFARFFFEGPVLSTLLWAHCCVVT